MAEYIKREDLERALENGSCRLEDLPSIDIVFCKDCKRNADNGGLYDDGRTKCPIQEHYALLKDGFCHLGERIGARERMKLPNDQIIHYEGKDGISIDITRTELVRCKDCKYWLPHTQCGFDEDNNEYHNYCKYHMPDDEWYAGYWEADDYCSYGERKDEED